MFEFEPQEPPPEMMPPVLVARKYTRREMAERVKDSPFDYMVCEGCGSILVRSFATMCPLCHGYQFGRDLEMVLEKAIELGERGDADEVIA